LNFANPDAIISFVMLALCFDYALFFWSRYAAERRKFPEERMVQRAVLTALTTSGYVILLSTILILLASIIMAFYPNHNNIGYLGLSLQFITGIVFVGFYSLVVPAILALLFPSLFDEPRSEGIQKWISDFVQEHLTVRPLWIKKVGEPITRRPWVCIVPLGICVCFIPLLYVLSTLNLDFDNYKTFASPLVPEFAAHEMYAEKFDTSFSPILVAIEAIPLNQSSQTNITLTSEFGLAVCRLVQLVLDETRGEAYQIDAKLVDALWWDADSGSCRDKARSEGSGLKSSLLSTDGQTQLMTLKKKVKGVHAEAMTLKFWSNIEPKADWTLPIDGQHYRFKASLVSSTAEEMLIERRDRNWFPWIMSCTVVGVCALLGYSFSSLFLSVKLVFTVFIPIFAEYGMLVGIYQYGWLDWLGIARVEGLPWPMMYSTPPLLFALAMDYDMFLFARVYERRLEGYDNRSAVRIALEETGPPITLAGSLMIVAFFFMFLNSIPSASITGCVYVIGVAVDTYIVRMWIAPASLAIYERMNYWPVEMPPPDKDYAYYDELSISDGVNKTCKNDLAVEGSPEGK